MAVFGNTQAIQRPAYETAMSMSSPSLCQKFPWSHSLKDLSSDIKLTIGLQCCDPGISMASLQNLPSLFGTGLKKNPSNKYPLLNILVTI